MDANEQYIFLLGAYLALIFNSAFGRGEEAPVETPRQREHFREIGRRLGAARDQLRRPS